MRFICTAPSPLTTAPDTSSTTRRISDGNQYMQIVRWNGALGSFKVLGGSPGVPVALNSGDTFCASSVGGVLKSWLVRAGATIQSTNPITDTTFTGGGPGVGFFSEGALSDNANFGFSSFQATEINSGAPAPPTNLRVTGVQIARFTANCPNPLKSWNLAFPGGARPTGQGKIVPAVHSCKLDSCPLAVSALTASTCFPLPIARGWLFPTISLVSECAPAGAGIENSLTGFPAPTS